MDHVSRNEELAHNPHHLSGDHSHHIDEWIKQEDGIIHISAKALNITWGNDTRFWQWVILSKEESCFEVGAELIQVNYLEVSGSLDLARFKLSPSKTYEILYMVKLKEDAFGWHSSPIIFEVITPDGHQSKKSQMLEPYRKNSHELQEIHGGEFRLASSNLMGKVKFGMFEVDTEWWKGGMVLEGVKVRPISTHHEISELRENLRAIRVERSSGCDAWARKMRRTARVFH